MKHHVALLFMLISISIMTLNNVMAQDGNSSSMLQPPATEKKPKITEINGDKLVDNYFWLREKSNPAVIAHLEAENAYASAAMKPTEALQDRLYKEILSHIKQTDTNVPYRWGDYMYYSRTEEGKQYPIYCRIPALNDKPPKEQVLLDLNEMAKGQKFMAVGSFVPSDDGNLLAYSTDNTGYRQYTLQVKNLSTGELLPEKDELFDIGTSRSRDKAVIMLGAFSKTSAEFRYIPANDPNAAWKIILPRQ